MIGRFGATEASALARRACAAAAFLVPAAVYAASASHEPASWDTAELQGVPYILGLTHPTGFPFYVLLGYAWSHLVPVSTIAFRMNLMSALAMAAVALAAYWTAVELGSWRPVALLAALWYAFVDDVWSHAIRAEAQDLAVACEAFALYAFLRWMNGAGDRWFAAACVLLGLGVAAHPNAVWMAPAFVAGAIVAERRPALRLVAGSGALVVCALSLYAYLPLRSAYVVAHGLDPTHVLAGAGGGIFWNYNDPSTLQGLWLTLTGSQSGTPGYFFASFNPVHVQDALWALIDGIGEQFGAFALLLAAVGAIAAWRRDRRTTLVLFMACTAALLFSVTYANEADVGRYRLMALWLIVPLLGAIVPARDSGGRLRWLRAAACAFLAIGTCTMLYGHRGFFDHAPGEGGRWMIDVVRPVVPAGSVIVVAGWLDATSLAYGAYADRSLPGRIIVSGWHPEEQRLYRSWAAERRVFILVDPHDVTQVGGTKPPISLDGYHELFEVRP